MSVDFSKPVQTRDGRPVTILRTDLANDVYPILGLYQCNGQTTASQWTVEGAYYDGSVDDRDLINATPKRFKVTQWANVYPHGVFMYGFRESADLCANRLTPGRVACVPITIEYEEGEGLDAKSQ